MRITNSAMHGYALILSKADTLGIQREFSTLLVTLMILGVFGSVAHGFGWLESNVTGRSLNRLLAISPEWTDWVFTYKLC
jgi:hypothetical protein